MALEAVRGKTGLASSTVFRGNLYDLPPKTAFYYTVESMDFRDKSDGVTRLIKTFNTQ